MLNQTSVRDILLTSYAQTVILKISLFSLVLISSKLFKVCGHDGLAADHFVIADGSINLYISIFVAFELVVAWIFTRGVYEIIYCTFD